jgi:hypothetical protein
MSIISSTDICNLALDLLSAGTVQDIETPSNATEELLQRWYGLTRKKLLREHPWNFAIRRAQLAASSTAPAFGYNKQYPVPADFVRLLTINDSVYTSDVPAPSSHYKVENNHILTSNLFADASVLNITYVSDFTTVSQMDPLFVDLLAYEIAVGVAYKLAESQANVQRVAEILRQKSALAKAVDGQEDPPRVIERSRSRHVRRNNHANVDSHRIKF